MITERELFEALLALHDDLSAEALETLTLWAQTQQALQALANPTHKSHQALVGALQRGLNDDEPE